MLGRPSPPISPDQAPIRYDDFAIAQIRLELVKLDWTTTMLCWNQDADHPTGLLDGNYLQKVYSNGWWTEAMLCFKESAHALQN